MSEVKRPEQALKLFLRFAIARGLVVYGMEIMTSIFEIIEGSTSTIMTTVGIGTATNTVLPRNYNCRRGLRIFRNIPLWAVSLLGSIFITILAFVMILTVYGRFFKLYMYTAISPVPLSCAAGETTQSVTVTFLKSYAGVCLEGAVIILLVYYLFSIRSFSTRSRCRC